MKRLRSIGLAIVAIGLSGCFLAETAASSAGIPSPAKVVADKAPPDTLIAADGTTCTVPRSRYDRVRIGQSITCVWTGSP